MGMGILVGTYSSIFIASVSLNAIYKAKRKATVQTV
jgi:preprotein translocase subunit SecF